MAMYKYDIDNILMHYVPNYVAQYRLIDFILQRVQANLHKSARNYYILVY